MGGIYADVREKTRTNVSPLPTGSEGIVGVAMLSISQTHQ